MTTPLSRDLALRIGLAARTLVPEMSLAELIDMLEAAVGFPLTREKLDGLSMKALKQAGGAHFAEISGDVRQAALAFLTGSNERADPDPEIMPYAEGDMPGSLRIACASNGGERLDGHFGACRQFLIYQVSQEEIRLIDIRAAYGDAEAADSTVWRVELIGDCHVVHLTAIGGPAVAKLVRAGIHPVKHAQPLSARAVMGDMQKVIAGSPPPWLARIMGREAETLRPFLLETEP